MPFVAQVSDMTHGPLVYFTSPVDVFKYYCKIFVDTFMSDDSVEVIITEQSLFNLWGAARYIS